VIFYTYLWCCAFFAARIEFFVLAQYQVSAFFAAVFLVCGGVWGEDGWGEGRKGYQFVDIAVC